VLVFRQVTADRWEHISEPPYRYDDRFLYSCQPGYVKESNVIFHYCDSKSSWTGRTVCKGKRRSNIFLQTTKIRFTLGVHSPARQQNPIQ